MGTHTKKVIIDANSRSPLIVITGDSPKVGRPPKEAKDKQNFKVTLSLKEEENAVLSKKAGVANKATFLHHFLTEQGFFDE